MASRVDESDDPKHRAALRQALGRNRRPGDSRPAARDISAGGESATLTLRPRPASPLTSTTVWPAFQPSYVGPIRDGVEMKVFSDGSLRIRSPRAASRYVGTEQTLADADGFVDTGDIVERRGRSLLLCRPQRRHHQRRRAEGSSGRDRGGHQSAPAGGNVAGVVETKSDHRCDRGRRRGPQIRSGRELARSKP